MISSEFFQPLNQDPRRGDHPPVMMLTDKGAMVVASYFKEKHGVEIFVPYAYRGIGRSDGLGELEEHLHKHKMLDLIYGVTLREEVAKAAFCLPSTINRKCNYEPFEGCMRDGGLYEYEEVHRVPVLYFRDEVGQKKIIISDSVGNPKMKWADNFVQDERFEGIEIYVDELPYSLARFGGGAGRVSDRGSCILDSLIFSKNALKMRYLPDSIRIPIDKGDGAVKCILPMELSKTAQSFRYFDIFPEDPDRESVLEKMSKHEFYTDSGIKRSSLLFRRGIRYAGEAEEVSAGAGMGKKFSIHEFVSTKSKDWLEEAYDLVSGEKSLRDNIGRVAPSKDAVLCREVITSIRSIYRGAESPSAHLAGSDFSTLEEEDYRGK